MQKGRKNEHRHRKITPESVDHDEVEKALRVTFTKTSHMAGKEQRNRISLDDQLRIENEIIKMKLMLEYGARFGSGQDSEKMEPALEHVFLKHVLAMEEAHRNGKNLTVFEKIGSPADIRPAEELSEDELPEALRELQERLAGHGIEVRPVEKNIDPEAFYRFLTKDLMEICVLDSPGIHCFLFEAHPAPEGSRLERIAQEACLQSIISGKAPLGEITKERPLRLNGFDHHDRTSIQQRLMRFRAPYEDVLGLDKRICRTIMEQDTCTVHGSHETALCMKDRCEIIRGDWFVTFQRSRSDEWGIAEIDIDGLRI